MKPEPADSADPAAEVYKIFTVLGGTALQQKGITSGLDAMRFNRQLRRHHVVERLENNHLFAEPRPEGRIDKMPNEAYDGICSDKVSRQFSVLIFVVLTGLVLSILSDRGSFFVWQDPLSDLGALRTVNGDLNVVPRTIFDLSMTISGLLMLRLYSFLSTDGGLLHAGAKRAMTFAGGIGFFMLLMPYDVDLAVHEIGASLVFATLWGMPVLFSVELKRASLTGRALIAQVVLQGTVLPYAILFVADMPGEVVAQKFAVIGLMFAVWYTAKSAKGRTERSAGYERQVRSAAREDARES